MPNSATWTERACGERQDRAELGVVNVEHDTALEQRDQIHLQR
jgi:hypothetical protein